MSEFMDQDQRAEAARRLLSDPIFVDALTAVRMEALLDLAETRPDDVMALQHLQAIVAVTMSLRDMLEAEITRSGARDGGVSAGVEMH